jgi:D-glucuronyl C5-epimerase C-terminus
VRLRLFGLLAMGAVFPGSAAAAPVVVLGPHGHTFVRNDRFLTAPAITPAPDRSAVAARARGVKHGKRKPRKTVSSELTRLYRAGEITSADYRGYKASWSAAGRSLRHLHGTRRTELGAVIANLDDFAARGKLIPSRLPVLFLTLDRNRQWWTTGSLLSYGQRVEFRGSQLAWEYYPGQGIELTALGNFGKIDGLYAAGRADWAQAESMLGEMLPLAARRGGGLTWEYYFKFDGGEPPWTSAMSQGTALEALTRADQALQKGGSGLEPVDYLGIARKALSIFTRRPPTGVAVPTARGKRYVQYSFAAAPSQNVINGFLQSLIGLYDYAQASGDATAQALFDAGNAEAQAELPSFDTGAWSLYEPGQEDSLDYHELVTGFLQQLCSRTDAQIYCTTADHFESYLKTPPALTLLTTRVHVRKKASISFRLSKISHVGIVVLSGTKTLFETSASFPYGVHSFSIPALRHKGSYEIHLAATDLAGNFNRIVGTLQVTK